MGLNRRERRPCHSLHQKGPGHPLQGIGRAKNGKRGGSGIKTAKITQKTGELVAAKVVSPELEEIIAISKKAQVIRTSLKEISELGRATQGVRVMRLDAKDSLASITCL